MKTNPNAGFEWLSEVVILGVKFGSKEVAILIFGMILIWIGLAGIVSGVVMIIEAVTCDTPFKQSKFHETSTSKPQERWS